MYRRKRSVSAGAGLLVAGVLAIVGPSGQTYAQYSDLGVVTTGAGAGVWAPDPPAACWPDWHKKHGWHWFMDWEDKDPDHHKDWDSGDWDKSHSSTKTFGGLGFGGPKAKGLSPFHGKSWPEMTTVYGTVFDDVLDGGNHPQIIMGLAGNDVLNGGNSLDCLVGGLGDDILNGGNSTDILIGGPGADQLNGGNGIDILIGDAGPDQLNGGNGPDIILAGRNDTILSREWWDIVIRIDELDDCDGSGGLGGILECLLPDVFSAAQTASLTFLDATADEEPTEDPKAERSLLAPEDLSEDPEGTEGPDAKQEESPPQVEGPEPGPATEGSVTDEPDPSVPADEPPAADSKDQATEQSPSDTSATTGEDSDESGTTANCTSSQPDDQNCEAKP